MFQGQAQEPQELSARSCVCLLVACLCLLMIACLFVGLLDYCLVSLFVGSFVPSFVVCLVVCLFVFLPVRSFVRSFVCLSLAFVLRHFLVGNATARVRRNRICEKTGGKGKEVGRQIGHHRTAKHKEPKKATGVQT